MRIQSSLPIAVTLLSLCVYSPVNAQQVNQQATLDVTTDETFPVGIFRLDGSLDRHRCSRDKAKLLGTLNNIAWGGGKKTNRLTFSIPAQGERFRFVAPVGLKGSLIDPAKRIYRQRVCLGHIDFIPAPNEKYLASFAIKNGECSMSLSRIDVSDKLADEPTVRVRPQCYLQNFIPKRFEKPAQEIYEKNPELYR